MLAEAQDSQESWLVAPLEELIPSCMLQELNQDGGRNNGVGESAVGYKGCALDTERVNQTKLITQGLAAVGCQLRPDAERAFVRADPDGLPNMPSRNDFSNEQL